MSLLLAVLLAQAASAERLASTACAGTAGPQLGLASLKQPQASPPQLADVLDESLLLSEDEEDPGSPHFPEWQQEEQLAAQIGSAWRSPVTTAPPAPSMPAVGAASVEAKHFSMPSLTDLPTPLPDALVLLVAFVAFKLIGWLRKADLSGGCFEEPFGRRPTHRREETDALGCTALHHAAHEGSSLKVRKLLEGGSDPNAREAWDETPLHMAARAGSIEAIEQLLDVGAELNARNADERTALDAAAEAGHEAVCDLLLDRGARTGGLDDSELPKLLSSLMLRRLLVPAEPKAEKDLDK